MQFTVIIPTFNRPTQLRECLASLCQLDFPRDQFEVVVVDDGSPAPIDSSVNSFREKLNLTLLTIENGGPGAPRNNGAEIAKGQFLAFTDDDCRPDRDWLTKLGRAFREDPDKMLGGRTINQLTKNPFSTTSQVIIDVVYSFYNIDPGDAVFFASNNMAVPADTFRKLRGFDTTFRLASEDRELCDRWRHAGYRIRYVPDALIWHAHSLGLLSFWRQHFNYGRGAQRYHELRVRRHSGRRLDTVKMHPLTPKLLLKPMSQLGFRDKIAVSALLGFWQIANTVGFFYEVFRRPKVKSVGSS